MKTCAVGLLPRAAIGLAQVNRDAGGRPIHKDAERLAQWKFVEMPFHAAGFTAREKQMVEKLVAASRLINSVYWRQTDTEGLEKFKATTDATLRSLFGIMGSRYDLLDENRPFLGAEKMPAGHDQYPHGLTRSRIEQYVKDHPRDRDAIYSPYTLVTWQGERLVGTPYREAYQEFLKPMAQLLRDAAGLSSDPAFSRFLTMRADAVMNDDYYASDMAWLDLRDPKFDVIFAPYESYLDDLLGVKTSYGAAVLVRNEGESRKLSMYQKYVPEIQDALPLDAIDRPSKHGHLTPMEVMDAPYRAGDLRYGYQAVADNLPNDPKIHEAKGTKKVFFKNFMDARVSYVILPIARRLMRADQAAKVSGDGYLASTLLHEISHGLGPAFARPDGKQISINEALGPVYSGLEEAKADVTGMFGLQWLVEHGAMAKERVEGDYASYVAGIFRTLRFGTGEAHGRAEMMEFNYLLEQKALGRLADGKYAIDFERIPSALAQLTKELLQMEASGDRARAEAWFTKYDRMPTELKVALAGTGDVPVDVEPVFSFPDRVQ